MGHEKEHSSEHETGGADEIDTDNLGVGGVPQKYDSLEHFLLGITELPLSGAKELYNKFLLDVVNTATKDTNTVLKLSASAANGEALFLFGLEEWNPADYSYLEMLFRIKVSTSFTLYLDNIYYGLIDFAFAKWACIMEGTLGAGYMNFQTTDGVDTETTENIVLDPAVYHIYSIQIKSGECKFYIDDVLKATHTTGVTYDASADGLRPQFYHTNAQAIATHQYHDYCDILCGRVF